MKNSITILWNMREKQKIILEAADMQKTIWKTVNKDMGKTLCTTILVSYLYYNGKTVDKNISRNVNFQVVYCGWMHVDKTMVNCRLIWLTS